VERVNEKLKHFTEDVKDYWQNIKEALLAAGRESLGYKSERKRNWVELVMKTNN
jgi:hypothetical protein